MPDELKFAESRPPAIVCPKCGATHGFRAAEVEQGNIGCLMLMLGGLLPYLLYRSSNREMLVCTRCHYVFEPSAPVNPIVAWIVLGLVIAAIIFLVIASR
jgi:rubredoxin